jgi:dCTP deaminase
MILSDNDIRNRCLREAWHGGKPLIEPFAQFWPYSEEQLPSGVISHGLTSAGYDLRMGNEVLLYRNSADVLSPKRMKDEAYRRTVFSRHVLTEGCGGWVRGWEGDLARQDEWRDPPNAFRIPAHGYILATSLETIRVPRNLKGRCVGKSTYARCCIIANLTPLEPGWEGRLTIEISNPTGSVAEVYAGEGIVQLEFDEIGPAPCQVSYADKAGKYQDQTSVTPARVL